MPCDDRRLTAQITLLLHGSSCSYDRTLQTEPDEAVRASGRKDLTLWHLWRGPLCSETPKSLRACWRGIARRARLSPRNRQAS